MKLYPYQEEAVEAMWDKPAFLLADEMGLGKTVMALEEVRRRREQGDFSSTLIVCPKSAISVWTDHIDMMFGEDARVGLPRTSKPGHVTGFVVTNWDQLRVNNAYRSPYWTYLIADEAHYAKNRKAKRTVALKHIPTRFKRALTGTPLVNRPDELWSLLNWLKPFDFTSYWKFYERFVDYYEIPQQGYHVIRGAKNVDELKKILKPLMLRRKKADVLEDLPDKYYTRIEVELSPQQRRVYKDMKKDALAWIGEHENEPLAAMNAISKLMRLRQIVCGYPEIDEEGTVIMREPSAKLDALMELLESTDGQVVVFTNFRSMVRMAAERLKKAGVSYTTLTGETPQEERGQHIASFQSGERRVFLGTIRAGGVGITLTAASTVVFLDRSWSPADNIQAEDRLHRIGQENAVQVVQVEASGTVDQVVEAKLEWKWKTIRAILEG